jgi:hypothetical protein
MRTAITIFGNGTSSKYSRLDSILVLVEHEHGGLHKTVIFVSNYGHSLLGE